MKKKTVLLLAVLGLVVLSLGAMATYTLCPIRNIPSAVGAIFTNGSSVTTYARLITIHNAYSVSENVSIYLVPNSGGSVGTAVDTGNRIEYLTVVGNDTVNLEFAAPGLRMAAQNDSIQAKTTTDSHVMIYISGFQE